MGLFAIPKRLLIMWPKLAGTMASAGSSILASNGFDRINNVVWDCLFALLKQPEWVYQQISKQETGENIEELQKRIRVERQKIERTQYKLRRIQEGFEADPPVYTADEVKGKIGGYRDLISRAEIEIRRLHEIVEQKAITKQTKEEALRILESLRDTNLEKASFDEKRNLTAKLGIKVYPSEDGKTVRISSTLQFAPSPLKVSPQIISIASPILIIPREFRECQTYLELSLVQS